MTDPTPAATARDALVTALVRTDNVPPWRGYEDWADRILAALPDGWTLAAAEAPGRVAALEAACSDRGCLHYDHEQPPCIGHMPSICCSALSAAIGAAAVADYRALAAAEAPGRVAALEAALARIRSLTDGMTVAEMERQYGSEQRVLFVIIPDIVDKALAAPAPTPSEPVARCVYCGNDGTGFRLSCCLTPGARDE